MKRLVFRVCDVLKFSIYIYIYTYTHTHIYIYIENFNTSQIIKTVSSYTVFKHFNTFVSHMGFHVTWT